jgi:AsmA protein
MNKLLKILLFVIGAIVTLSVAATIAISLLVDAGTINNEVKAIVKQQTGGNLDIKGGMSWSIYPEISLSLADVSYTNSGEKQPLARLDALKLSIALMPLFSGSVNVSGISLDGMTLNLVVANDGTKNWQQRKPAANMPSTTKQPTTSSNGRNMSIAIEIISITNATINYNDLATGTSAALSNFSFHSSNANIVGNVFPMKLGFSLKATKPNAAVVVDLTANMAVNAANSTLSLEDLVINKQVKLDATNGNMNIAANVAGNLSADGVSEVLSITGLTVTANVSSDATSGEPLPISFTGDLSADNKAGKFELSNYQLDAVDLTINGSIKGTKIGDEFSVSGPIAIAEFDLKKLLTTLSQSPPDTTNKDALTKVSLSANLNYQGSSAMLQQLTISLDQTNITGFAGLTNIDQQLVVADLTIDSINLDDYMPPIAAAAPAASGKPVSVPSQITETPLPLDTLKTINALIKIAINKFVINGLDATNFNLNTRANLGLVELKNLSVDLYNGEIKTTGLLDARPTLATLKAKVNINGVEMKPVLSAVSEVDWLNGKTNLNANITTKGNTVEAWQRGLNGSANFAMTNLLAEGISIDKQLCQSIALIKGKTLSNQWSENTALDNLNGKIRFINGTMQNDSLTGGSSTIKLTGNGWLSPEKNKMNYKLGVQITGDQISQDPACEVNKRYRDISWPLQCKGQLDTEPKNLCGIDQSKMKDIVKDLTVDEVGRKASNELDKYLKDKNLEGVGDLLKGLFK